jgi:hypothetical protein
MKKTGRGITAALRIIGINPAVAVMALVLLLLCGIMLGTFAKNASKRPARVRQVARVVEPQPEESPYEKPKERSRPKPGPKTPFAANSVPVGEHVSGPVVAIIIDDMGVDMARSNRILRLDAPLTVSYLPHAPSLQAQIDAARAEGKEVMLHIPMEAASSVYANDYGPEHLKTSESRSANVRLLREILARATGYVGINNHMGSRFTLDSGQMSSVMEELSKQGLAFVDSKTATTNLGPAARQHKMPFAERDVFLDDSSAPEDIRARLLDLERIARRRGWAVAIAHPRENTIRVLSEWLEGDHGITVVPISYIIMKYN